jgi:hypothetical protein
MLGFPESGKTTFLAALWHVLSTGDVPGSLRLGSIAGDKAHLKAIHEAWLACETAVHTSREATEVVEFDLLAGSEKSGRLVIPDLAGDLLADYMAARIWPADFDTSVRSASAVLVFVNAGNVNEGVRTEDAIEWTAGVAEAKDRTNAEAGEHLAQGPTLDFDPTSLPTQVMVVDLLQQLRARAGNTRIGVVISAWDVAHDHPTPAGWLAKRLPILSQYLGYHAPATPMFGVSAQGGKFPDESKAMAAIARPSDRIQVTDGTSGDHDISRPLRVLLGLPSQ